MFEIKPTPFYKGDFDRPSHGSHAVLLNQATDLFSQARWNAALAKLIAILGGRSQALLDLEIIPLNLVRNQRYGGIRPIHIDKICGSLGRSADFDRQFHPLSDRIRDRWVSIAMARKQNLPLAPVDLIQVGGRYFVKDGHHRISVACARGESFIDAEIIVWDVMGSLPWETQLAAHILPEIAST